MYNQKESKTFKVIYWIESKFLKNLKIKPFYLSFVLDNFALVAFQRLPQPLSCSISFRFKDSHKDQKRSF